MIGNSLVHWGNPSKVGVCFGDESRRRAKTEFTSREQARKYYDVFQSPKRKRENFPEKWGEPLQVAVLTVEWAISLFSRKKVHYESPSERSTNLRKLQSRKAAGTCLRHLQVQSTPQTASGIKNLAGTPVPLGEQYAASFRC